MQVIVVHDFADTSLGAGATRCAVDGAIAVAEAGHNVHFFAAVGSPDPALIAAGITVTSLGQQDILRSRRRFAASASGLWNRGAAFALKALLDSHPQESTVVHVHTWSKALSPAVLPVLTATEHTLFHLHEYFAACPNGGFFNYQKSQVCEQIPMSLGCASTNCDARSPLHKAWRAGRHVVMRNFGGYPEKGRHFAVLSRKQSDVLAPYLPKRARIELVRNPVDIERQPWLPRQQASKFLFVGRISSEKGVSVLAEAFRERQEDLVVIGAGPQESYLKSELPGAEFLGWQNSNRVKALMRYARALVFPSLWFEGMPMVVVEALASGLPVICSDISAAAEIVEDGVSGLIVRAGDREGWRAAVARCDEISFADALSAQAYQRYWKDPFSKEKFRNIILAIYEEILSGKRPT